jgi:hypothetical protein
MVDSLTPQALLAIDSAMIKFVSSRPRKVIAIVRYMVVDSSAPIPWLPDRSGRWRRIWSPTGQKRPVRRCAPAPLTRPVATGRATVYSSTNATDAPVDSRI